MIKRLIPVCMLTALCIMAAVPVLVSAQNGPSITATSTETGYPLTLNFSLSAESGEDITDIRLSYSLERDSFADVTSESFVEFQPGRQVEVEWTWDMRQTGGLPPGATVRYYWTVEDASGAVTTTQPKEVRFEDNRFNWQEKTAGDITIYWYEGNQAFADQLMNAAVTATNRLTADTGAYLRKPVSLYIYAGAQDLRGALVFPQEWTGGVAYTEYGIIAIGIGPRDLDWGVRAIAHEISHLVVHQATFNPYTWLPTWLEEGLATYNEGDPLPTFTASLESAVDSGQLITVRSLASAFSAFSDEALLSYAESQSIVEYLVETYGKDKMLKLLTTFSQGSGYDDALEAVYGFDMDGLNDEWQKYLFLGGQSGVETALAGSAGYEAK